MNRWLMAPLFAVLLLTLRCGPGLDVTRSACTYAAQWAVVDDFVYLANTGSLPQGIAIDGSGTIYVGGTTKGVPHWLVRRSSDHGATWSTVDDFVLGGNAADTEAMKGVVDAAGAVYFGGTGSTPDGANYSWLVRKSADGGQSWATVDNYVIGGGNSGLASGMAVDSSGNLFAAGNTRDGANNYHWIVRKSSNGGQSWTTSDDFTNSSTDAEASGLFVDSSQTIRAFGAAYNGSNDLWIVRASTNGGSSWNAPADSFLYSGGNASRAYGMAQDPSGRLFAVGSGNDGGNHYHWIVRRSTDGGTTWSTLDDYQRASNKNSQASSAVIDAQGALYVAGLAGDTSGHWLVRKSSDGGVTWAISDDYLYGASGSTSAAVLAAMDPSGNLYVIGVGSDGTLSHWIVRKLACQ